MTARRTLIGPLTVLPIGPLTVLPIGPPSSARFAVECTMRERISRHIWRKGR